jgi:hypothetical protein
MFKSENFALTFSAGWLLVRAVTGGAIPKAFGIWQKPNTYSCEHVARANEPEAKQKYQISFVGIILEVISAEKIIDAHRAQALNYLKATGMRLAIILNFGKE